MKMDKQLNLKQIWLEKETDIFPERDRALIIFFS